jgi:hypothetical protein
MNDMIYTTDKKPHYPLTLNATYTCSTGTHSFWYQDAIAERRIDYSRHMTIQEALREFLQGRVAQGGKLVIGTDPITSRKIAEAFRKEMGKERKIALEQRVVQFEPDVPLSAEHMAA